MIIINYSKQRQLIEDAVKSHKIHPTADDIYAMLKPDNPNLSLGTVYRNINILAKNGVINKVHMPGGRDRFDGELKEHYHVICDKCNGIFDVQIPLSFYLNDKINRDIGVTVTSYQLIINGICKDCAEKK